MVKRAKLTLDQPQVAADEPSEERPDKPRKARTETTTETTTEARTADRPARPAASPGARTANSRGAVPTTATRQPADKRAVLVGLVVLGVVTVASLLIFRRKIF